MGSCSHRIFKSVYVLCSTQVRADLYALLKNDLEKIENLLTLELNVTLIFSMMSTKISSLFLPPGSLATTDFVTAVPGILLLPCCKFKNKSNWLCAWKNEDRMRLRSLSITWEFVSLEYTRIRRMKDTINMAAGPRGGRRAASITIGSLNT